MTHHQKGTRVNRITRSARTPSLKTGRFAVPFSLLRGAGSGALSSGRGGRTFHLKLLTLTVAVTAAFLALTASSAFAARGHEYLGETIGKPCTETSCGREELTEPAGVAVNEATGDIYVVDAGNHRVQVFDPTGAFLFMFGGEVNKTAVETVGREAEANLCPAPGHPGDECQPGTAATTPGAFKEPISIAIDNTCHLAGKSGAECTSLDPSSEAVYVEEPGTGSGGGAISKFSSSGAFLGQITEGEGGPFTRKLEGLAVDTHGNVWIDQEDRTASKFANGPANAFIERIELGGLPDFPLPGGLAVDSAGNLYVRHGDTGTSRIAKFDPTGNKLIEALDPEQSSSVAVDQIADTPFVDNLTSVAAFSPEGAELERFGFNHELSEGAGIGVNASTGFAYVADHAAGNLLVLAPRPAGPPTIETANQFVSEVTSNSATVHGEINPRSDEGEDPTTYRFQYGPCASLATCASSPFSFATPDATLPPNFVPHSVEAELSSLQSDTVYHYRLSAENSHSLAPTLGEESTFTTESAGPLALPDARQWELVSPPDKLGARIEPISETGVVQAAAAGDAITYIASTPSQAEPAGFTLQDQIRSARSTAGWSTRDLGIPHTAATGFPFGGGPEYKFFDSELTAAVVQPFGPFDPALSLEASESTAYLHDLGPACGSHCYRPLVTAQPGFENALPGFGEEGICEPHSSGVANGSCGPAFQGATDDLSHVVISSEVPLLTGAGTSGLYEWHDGTLAQVNLLPEGGGPAPGAYLGTRHNTSTRRAISADGSRITWTQDTGTSTGLYLRDMALAETVQLDQAEAGCATCESGAAQFQIASADGSRVFFTDEHRLTEGSGAEHEKPDLYECAIEVDGEGHLACDLTDLTPANGGEPADVLGLGFGGFNVGAILGASEDGSYLYFGAEGNLTEGPSCGIPCSGEEPVPGQPNLYLLHEGTTSFIATLSEGDSHDWATTLAGQPTRVSANGQWLVLMSQAGLTGYDNRDLATGRPVAEVYLYSAADSRLICASCEPTGARPTGVEFKTLVPNRGIVGGKSLWPATAWVAANVPPWTAIGGAGTISRHQPRYLSDQGRLFFDTAGALVPQDSNATQDVYEYEPVGVGGCTTALTTFSERNGGCVSLISAGTSREESAFLDASESGDDVFFLTSSRLVPADEDAARDVYDAHSCPPGAAVPCLPEPPPPPPACVGDACQQPVAPPNDATPGSLTFNGAGNLLECSKGKVKRSGKCVKRKKAKHHKKKAHGKKSHRAASHNRGGQK